ncbi:hypothetical protein HYN69_13520 [Gemmobacter aquarius]|uniref:Glycosyltransferase 2-like domain-containing protein n=1 Tax=Paragemmobacter aquarius TaxID=2169400 RepID=A0A2S0UNL2_9RHOB|nr:hypothetical protein HYN69_13520 [Gemmobacter aquarius]
MCRAAASAGPCPARGVILSHDFVEAALLRRAGWGVRMMAGAEDSFEDTPETLLGYLRRDRRWCQGNMQHLRLIGMPGLHPMSRFHLLQGAMSYLASVWWLMLLVLRALPGWGGSSVDVFAANPYLPGFPMLPPVTQGALAALVGLALMAPKVLGIIGHVRDHGLSLSDAPRFGLVVLSEITVSALLAPMQMVHQVRAVLRTFAGFDGGWTAHATGSLTVFQLMRFHATETLLGAVLLGLWAAGLVTAFGSCRWQSACAFRSGWPPFSRCQWPYFTAARNKGSPHEHHWVWIGYWLGTCPCGLGGESRLQWGGRGLRGAGRHLSHRLAGRRQGPGPRDHPAAWLWRRGSGHDPQQGDGKPDVGAWLCRDRAGRATPQFRCGADMGFSPRPPCDPRRDRLPDFGCR